jgi:uncharacterized surface protein with fasciclin (FAS1) repeats
MRKLATIIMTAIALALPIGASIATPQQTSPALASSAWDIVDTASSDGRFTTLVAAVQAAGLVDTLKSDGPFTVFAPTDEAFANLPPGTIDSLLANPDVLSQILLYHVVPGAVTASDVVQVTSAQTAQGQPVTVTVGSDGVMINESKVVITDVMASNGVIHVIDAVLLPPAR